MARRSRRINSSLFPENIGPQIASIHPRLPLTKSIKKTFLSYSDLQFFGSIGRRFGTTNRRTEQPNNRRTASRQRLDASYHVYDHVQAGTAICSLVRQFGTAN